MKKYLALIVVFSTIASATALAGQAEYDKCLKKCLKLSKTDQEKELCPQFCKLYSEENWDK